jgi:transcriptional regulator with XRE-family HTH domain
MRIATQTRPRLRLQDERERRNWSRANVAALADCSESLIAKVETGVTRGSWSLRKRLSRLFDLPAEELLAEVSV